MRQIYAVADPGFPMGGGEHGPIRGGCARRRPVLPQLIFIVLVVDFCSTSRFYIYIVCVDRSGSLSGGAFNQLRLVTLNIVLTILY